MKELKSKKTGKIQIVTDDQFRMMSKLRNGEFIKRFTVTDLSPRAAMPRIQPVKTKNK